jgi:SSS family solute:Na+ symporter
VYTLGGWLRQRYSPLVGNVYNAIWILVWMPFGLGLYIYAGSLILNTLVGWDLGLSIVVLTLVASIYTLLGGFRAVVATDVVQLFFMIFPLLVVRGIISCTVGGPVDLLREIPASKADLWSSDTPFGPIGVLFFGHIAMALSFWTCDAQLVQRPLSTSNENEAAVAYLGAGFWYVLIVPFVAIFPGLAAISSFPDLAKSDYAAPMILREYLPPGLYGVAIVGLLSGVLSSVDSTLNAFCTMFTREIYVGIWNREASDQRQLTVSRYAGIVLTLVGIGTAYYFSFNDSMFVSIAKIIAIIMPPLGAITVLGALWQRCSNRAAIAGLLAGYGCSLSLAILDRANRLAVIAAEPAFFNGLVSFVVTVVVVCLISLVAPQRASVTSSRNHSCPVARSGWGACWGSPSC